LHPRRTFSIQAVDIILRAFQPFILRREVSAAIVRTVIENSEELQIMMEEELWWLEPRQRVKRIYDRVRCEIRKLN
jgi:hypothetical protein